jgi:DNA gyrase subunit B
MPLYRKLSDLREPGITIGGYEMVWDPRSDSWLFTHMLADWYNRWSGVYRKADGDHCHHIDFNKLNNNPTNLQRLPKEEHWALHRQQLSQTLHRPDVKERSRRIHQSEEFRDRMSRRMREPETRCILSEQAKAQWADEAYKAYMGERWREFYEQDEAYREANRERLLQAQSAYWSEDANRGAQAERVRTYFANNPAVRQAFSERAITQWNNEELLAWRRDQTKQQWTPEFRAKRRAALARTYYRKTIAALKRFETHSGHVDQQAYDGYRVATRDKSLLRFDTFCRKFFDGNAALALEAVKNYNHKVVSVERLEECRDVYDAEVPGTHNFALASGVFVHNSAKQGRDNRTQAVLPLRGKILNSEGLTLGKVMANAELADLVSAIGTGVGDKFDLRGLRYGKLILLMDADADGHHITTLLLAFFFRHMTELIRKGHVFIAQPPLYRIDVGKETFWARDDAHKEEILANLRANAKPEITRFKGLGEMPPATLKATTLDPRHRTLLRVSIESNLEADETFVVLLGKDPALRYRFIMDSAALAVAEELDV